MTKEKPMTSTEQGDSTKAAIELRRCLHSLHGQLEYIREHMPVGPEGFSLAAVCEGGFPEILALADQVCGNGDDPPKSFNRGYQVMALMAREEETGVRNPEAWQEDPDEFMARWRS